MYNYIGKSIVRDDTIKKAQGTARYICDMQRVDMLYAKILFSSKPHAKFTIDATKALALPGIVAVYTHQDIPKIKYNPYKWYQGQADIEDEYLLTDIARFDGDRLAMVVGESLEIVQKALRLIKVEYEDLAATISLEDAIINQKIAFEKELKVGDFEQIATQAACIVEDEGYTPKVHHSAIEPHICLTEYDEFDNLVIWTPCQTAFRMQYHVANILGIPYNKIRAIKALMGGSFGGKGQMLLEPLAAFATYKLGRPVKLAMDRSEALRGSCSRNATKIKVKTAFAKDGKIIGRHIQAAIDGGAYYTNAVAVAMGMGKKVFRLYDIPNQTFEATTYYTNTINGGACRGYGSPQVYAISEVNLDNAALKLGLDPCELRLKNMLEPFSLDPIGAPAMGNSQAKKCLQVGMEQFDWLKRRAAVSAKNCDRYAYGLGMACGLHGNGYKGAAPDFMDVDLRIMPDNSIYLKMAVHEQGCGTLISLKQILAEALKVDINDIAITETDTLNSPYDSAGTQASRVTFVCGGAAKQAGEEMLLKIKNIFSELKNCPPDQIICENGNIWAAGSKEIYTYGQIAAEYEGKCSAMLSHYTRFQSPGNPSSNAVVFAEVKVDKYIGHVAIEDILIVQDVGQSINPVQVEGQIHGGAHMSLGMALREQIEYSNSGNIKSTNFSKYHLLNAREMPPIKIITIEEAEPLAPYGAKSVGEIAAVAPAPAIINAINHALNTNITTFPATPEIIIEHLALQQK